MASLDRTAYTRARRSDFRLGLRFRKWDRLVARMTSMLQEIERISRFENVENIIERQHKQRFDMFGPRAKKNPDGVRWKPLSPATVAERRRKGFSGTDTLVRTGKLKNSITVSRKRSFRFRGGLGTTVFTVRANAPYASLHQFGSGATRGRRRRVPARPFMGFGAKDLREIRSEVFRLQSGILRSFFRRG